MWTCEDTVAADTRLSVFTAEGADSAEESKNLESYAADIAIYLAHDFPWGTDPNILRWNGPCGTGALASGFSFTAGGRSTLSGQPHVYQGPRRL